MSSSVAGRSAVAGGDRRSFLHLDSTNVAEGAPGESAEAFGRPARRQQACPAIISHGVNKKIRICRVAPAGQLENCRVVSLSCPPFNQN